MEKTQVFLERGSGDNPFFQKRVSPGRVWESPNIPEKKVDFRERLWLRAAGLTLGEEHDKIRNMLKPVDG